MKVEPEKVIPLNVAFNKDLGNAVYIPFEKADTGKRIIRGYATTAALDREDQIVTKSAVEGAIDDYIENSNGTIRADHRPPSVGQTIHHELDNKGLLIHARINKGYTAAEDVWAATLQGAYNAFSIGGMIREARRRFDKSLDKQVTEITKISIGEISVVDAPANPECGFEVLMKSLDKVPLKEEISMDDDEKEKETEKAIDPTEGGTPSTEERLAKLESIVGQILERLPPTEQAPVAASINAKDLTKALVAEITPILEKQLGIKEQEVPLKKARQETPTGLNEPPQDPSATTTDDKTPFTTTEMVLKSLGFKPEVE